MKRLKHTLIVGSMALALGACGSDGGSSPIPGATPTPTPTPTPSPTASPTPTTAQAIAQLEASGSLPVLDRSSSIPGPDTNSNGIRDDIDTFIGAQTYTEPQRAAVQMLARATQRAVTADATSATVVAEVNLLDARAVNCTFLRFGAGSPAAGRAAETIEKMTANTRPRLLAYLAFAKATDGSVLPSPEGDTCD